MSLELFIPEGQKPGAVISLPGDSYYGLQQADTGPQLKKTVVGPGSHIGFSDPTNDEVLEYIDVVREMHDAAKSLKEEATPEAPIVSECVHTEGAGNTDYTYSDLERFLAQSDITSKTSLIHPAIDTERPDYWVRVAADTSLLHDETVPVNESAVLEHLTGLNEEYARLEACGVIVPPHTHFVVTDQRTEKQLIFTVSQNVGDGETLGHIRGPYDNPELAPQQLRTTRALFDYLTTSMERGGRHLVDLTHPGQWGKNGELYDLDPWMKDSLSGVRTELIELVRWVEQLPSSPEQADLRQRINQTLQEMTD